MDEWRARMGPRARALFDRFEAMVAACGEYHLSPAKTRVAFLGRVRFASVTAVSEESMTCGFSLPRPVRSRRLKKVEEVVPGWWVHTLRVASIEELDDEVQAWIRESYRLMGMQERLAKRGAASARTAAPTRVVKPSGTRRRPS
jgi:hypothetical protein